MAPNRATHHIDLWRGKRCLMIMGERRGDYMGGRWVTKYEKTDYVTGEFIPLNFRKSKYTITEIWKRHGA